MKHRFVASLSLFLLMSYSLTALGYMPASASYSYEFDELYESGCSEQQIMTAYEFGHLAVQDLVDMGGCSDPGKANSYLNLLVNSNQAQYEDDDCIFCGEGFRNFTDLALGLAPFITQGYIQNQWSNAYEDANQARWAAYGKYADAIAQFPVECTNGLNSWLDHQYNVGAGAVSADGVGQFYESCGSLLQYAGYAGAFPNGYGGWGNGWTGAGYTPGFMGSMVGPYFGGQSVGGIFPSAAGFPNSGFYGYMNGGAQGMGGNSLALLALSGLLGNSIQGSIVGSITGGYASGGFSSGGYISGGMISGGYVAGGVPGGYISGGVPGGYVSGGMISGGYVAGGVPGGYISGGIPGGYVSGGMISGGYVAGGVPGGWPLPNTNTNVNYGPWNYQNSHCMAIGVCGQNNGWSGTPGWNWGGSPYYNANNSLVPFNTGNGSYWNNTGGQWNGNNQWNSQYQNYYQQQMQQQQLNNQQYQALASRGQAALQGLQYANAGLQENYVNAYRDLYGSGMFNGGYYGNVPYGAANLSANFNIGWP